MKSRIDAIEDIIKPYGKYKWHDWVFNKICELVSENDQSVILDAGCGTDSWIIKRVRNQNKSIYVIGIDIDPNGKNNQDIDEFHQASVNKLPCGENSIDVVVCSWVLEHIEDPEEALNEINRVLKPGGCFIFWTPNKYNPAMLISAHTNQKLHRLIMRMLLRHSEWDNCQTFYRMNSIRDLEAQATKSGFEIKELVLTNGAYQYFRNSSCLYIFACLVSKAFNLWPLNKLKQRILGVFKKDLMK